MFPLVIALLALSPTPEARLANAQREDRAGWVKLRLAGSPADIGYQYGFLAAREIADAHAALKADIVSGGKTWELYRNSARDLFEERLDPEIREEMQGQVEGLRAQGVAVDFPDVLAFNAHIEIGGYYLPWLKKQKTGATESGSKESCSAFVATGSYTGDARPVIGHNLWWDYLMGQRFNLILDIRPEKGKRFIMDALAGFIHSGSDFAINGAGISLCETTISGFVGFDPKGIPEFQRMRKAIQYGTSIDEVSSIFRTGNNGGYANTWLIADNKTGEIGRLELGLKNVTLDRTKDGYFVGANFPINPKLIAEETIMYSPDPKRNGNLRRQCRFDTLIRGAAGKINDHLAKEFLADTYDEVLDRRGASGSTLSGRSDASLSGAVNTKVADAAMIDKMQFWARMGFTDGSVFDAPAYLASRPSRAWLAPYLRSIPAQPWIVVVPASSRN